MDGRTLKHGPTSSSHRSWAVPALLLVALGHLLGPVSVQAQLGTAATPSLDSLVSRALEVNPSIRAAQRRVDAARARTGPAGALPDPTLRAGLMDFPVADPGFGDLMTMKTVGVGQSFPYPGKLSLARRAAELEVVAARARLEDARLAVEEQVRTAFYDLAFLDRSLEVVEENQRLLVDFIRVVEGRYEVGTGGQEDVLEARIEAARLAEEAVVLSEDRRSRLAGLNAILDRPGDTPVGRVRVPERIERFAGLSGPSELRFTSRGLGARTADSPLAPLDVLQERAVRGSPTSRGHRSAIAAQEVRVGLARKAHLPDFDVSVTYGQRDGRADMGSFMVSVPIPVRRGERQSQTVAEAEAELAAMRAEHDAMVNDLEADVARAYNEVEKERARLALFARSIIPQGRAALEAAVAAYRVDRSDFLTLLEHHLTLYDYEIAHVRALTDFAASLARLERVVGGEVVR